jgi:coenzyme F420-0:L-glutamate ligase/coenzyme F420-1:gamma-L-glutamate ligase
MTELQPESLVLEAIINRRSIRRYTPQPVPRQLIERLLTAAIWAPSAHNRQPWRFAVIETNAVKNRLAQAMGEKLRSDLEDDRVPEELIVKDVRRSYDRITSAPVVIVLSLSMYEMDVYPDPRRSHNEYIMAVQSTAMAGQNLLLSASALGLGACWMCAPLFCPEVVRQVLGIPEDWQPQALLTVGFPAQQPPQKTRYPLEGRVKWL